MYNEFCGYERVVLQYTQATVDIGSLLCMMREERREEEKEMDEEEDQRTGIQNAQGTI